MVDRQIAKKIASAILDASTMEELAFRFAALGINFPEDPFSRCRILDGFLLCRKNRRNNIVSIALSNMVMFEAARTAGRSFCSSRRTLLDKLETYASESVDLTDRQADQIFHEIVYANKPVAIWRKLALARYWRKKRKLIWQA